MMKIFKGMMVGSVLAISTICLAEMEYKLERYEVILDRSPFGANPLLGASSEGSAKASADAVQAAAKELRLCFLLESESGEIRAGFENKKAKEGESKSITLMVGESFMGMKLLSIDIANSQATLLTKGNQVTFELSKAPTAAKVAAARAEQPQRRFGGGFRRTPSRPPEKPLEPQLSPEEQRLRREEIRANLQDYQMEVIRSGMPPLPIPLTPEMDDQLVTEGILPPE